MKRIEVNIECKTGENDLPEDISNLVEQDIEYRRGFINIDHIICYYPDHENKCTYIITIYSPIIVKESFEKVENLIYFEERNIQN